MNVVIVVVAGDIMVDFNDIVNLGDVADGVDVADLTDVADVDNASDFAAVGNVSDVGNVADIGDVVADFDFVSEPANGLAIGVENIVEVDAVDSFIVCNVVVVSFVIIANVDISDAIAIGATVDEGDVSKWVIFLTVSYLGPKEVKCTSIFLEVSKTKCVTDVSLVVMDFPVVVVAIVSVVIHVDPVGSVEYDDFAVIVVVVLAVLVGFVVVVVIFAVPVFFVVADVSFTTVVVAIDIFLAVSKLILGEV